MWAVWGTLRQSGGLNVGLEVAYKALLQIKIQQRLIHQVNHNPMNFNFTPSLEQIQIPVLGPQRWYEIPLLQDCLKKWQVALREPSLQIFAGVLMDQENCTVFVSILQGDGVTVGIGIGFVYPVDEWLFKPDNQEFAIQHGGDSSHGNMACGGRILQADS
jgi:hypothetical protein